MSHFNLIAQPKQYFQTYKTGGSIGKSGSFYTLRPFSAPPSLEDIT